MSNPPTSTPPPLHPSVAGEPKTAFPVVGIGASAGGLEALEQLLQNVPVKTGMAFVVIQHLDPNQKGMLPELLQRATAMPVQQAADGLRVQPDHVYVIPPNRDLTIRNGQLHLAEQAAPRGLRLPIDVFFRSLADERKSLAVGVVLSGMGSDGSLGLRAIKEAGGLVLVQDPASAAFDSMPRSAMDAGLVDIVALAEDLPARIIDILRHPLTRVQGDPIIDTTTRGAIEQVVQLMQARTRHDFSLYKRSTLYRRIERRMAIHRISQTTAYVRYLRENPQELDLLFKELLIGVTSFFRDPATWKVLQEQALPQLLSDNPDGKALRAWVVGCSTGEEAYSLAMTFIEVIEQLKPAGRFTLQIFATDLAGDAIDKARLGLYPTNIAADVSAERLSRFFVEEAGALRVRRQVREMVTFAPQDVIRDPPFTRLDILSCRNLLIYFEAELQKRLLPLFHYSLNPNGFLFLGSAEAVGSFTSQFTALQPGVRIYRRHGGSMHMDAMTFADRRTHRDASVRVPAGEAAPEPTLQALTDQLLMDQFCPAAVLINGMGDVLYIRGRTGKYLEPAVGKANWNVHAMAREGLRTELTTAIGAALHRNADVLLKGIEVRGDRGAQIVNVAVHFIDKPALLHGMLLIVFTDVSATSTVRVPRPSRNAKVTELQRTLHQAQLEAQTYREAMQVSQEELKSANEEMQSTNEELQSMNEELTTSKEEMQSMNEELQMVNHELQAKVDELSWASDDMENLLNSTDIATVYLNNALNVRRFTTQATRIFKLIPGDIGRALSDIVTDLNYPGLQSDAQQVLRTLAFCEKQIATGDGRWFSVRIMPYRTMENSIDGVVITFWEITATKRLEGELRATIGRQS